MNVFYCKYDEDASYMGIVVISPNIDFKDRTTQLGNYYFKKIFGFLPLPGEVHRVETVAIKES
jgi:hypothetical protein